MGRRSPRHSSAPRRRTGSPRPRAPFRRFPGSLPPTHVFIRLRCIGPKTSFLPGCSALPNRASSSARATKLDASAERRSRAFDTGRQEVLQFHPVERNPEHRRNPARARNRASSPSGRAPCAPPAGCALTLAVGLDEVEPLALPASSCGPPAALPACPAHEHVAARAGRAPSAAPPPRASRRAAEQASSRSASSRARVFLLVLRQQQRRFEVGQPRGHHAGSPPPAPSCSASACSI